MFKKKKKSTAAILGHGRDCFFFPTSTFPSVTNQHGDQCERDSLGYTDSYRSRNYYRLAVITLKFLRQVAGAQCQFISRPTRNLFTQSSSKSWKNDFIFYFHHFFSQPNSTLPVLKKVLTGYILIVIVKAPRRSPRASKFVKGGGGTVAGSA